MVYGISLRRPLISIVVYLAGGATKYLEIALKDIAVYLRTPRQRRKHKLWLVLKRMGGHWWVGGSGGG